LGKHSLTSDLQLFPAPERSTHDASHHPTFILVNHTVVLFPKILLSPFIMSGLEAFGVLGTAATVVELSLKILKELDRFVRESKDADAVAKELHAKVHQLYTCAETVQRVARSRGRQAGRNQQDEDEIQIWNAIRATLRRCEKLFQRFQTALEGLEQGYTKLGWLQKALLQRRIDARQPKISRLERKIDFHLSTLQISVLSVHL
jgi:hypothetical protein